MGKHFEDSLQQAIESSPWDAGAFVDYSQLKHLLQGFVQRRKQLQQQHATRISATDLALLLGRPPPPLPQLPAAASAADPTVESSLSYFQYGGTNIDNSNGDDGDSVYVDVADALSRLSIVERDTFSDLLQLELSKAATYYKKTIVPKVAMLSNRTTNLVINDNALAELVDAVLDATAFVVAQVITFRQALIRYDAFCRTYNSAMMLTEWHMQLHIQDDMLDLDLLRSDAVLERLAEDANNTQLESALRNGLRHLNRLLGRTDHALQSAVNGHIVFQDKIVGRVLRQYWKFGLQSYGLWIDGNPTMRGRHLKEEIDGVASFRRRANHQPAQPPLSSRLEELDGRNVVPLVLNLLSCFFFMMNNYIVGIWSRVFLFRIWSLFFSWPKLMLLFFSKLPFFSD
jgi:ACT domain-containing protein